MGQQTGKLFLDASYLPREWVVDPSRRAQAKIPEEVTFRTKPKMALDLIARWVLEGVEKVPVHRSPGLMETRWNDPVAKAPGLMVLCEGAARVAHASRGGRRVSSQKGGVTEGRG